MKKTVFLVLIILVLATAAWAQETTWTNPKATAEGMIPRSMLSDLTSGLLYDEIDTIVLSPAELSNYAGYGLFTAYSNFDWYWNSASGPAGAAVNPFVPAAFGYGRYLVGATLPVFKMRMGTFIGAQLNSTGLLDQDNSGITANVSSYEATHDGTADAFTIGTADYTTSLSVKGEGTRTTNRFAAAAGIDLGFMGASILADVESNADSIAATTHYTWKLGTDAGYVYPALANDTITEYWGLLGKVDPTDPAEAAAETYTNAANKWFLALTGEVPIPNLPITARLGAGGGTNLGLAFVYPYTQVWTVTNVAGAASTTATRSGYTISGLTTATTGTFFVTDLPADGSAFDVTTIGIPATAASDPAHFADSDFYGRIGAYVDPTFPMTDVISIKARAGADYMLDAVSANPATINVMDYTNTTGGTGHFNITTTVTAPRTTLTHSIDLDLGGVFVFTESTKLLMAQVGFFYIPSFSFSTTTYGTSVTTTKRTYSETAATTGEATAVSGVGPGLGLGTSTVKASTVTTGGNGVTTITHELNMPLAVRLNIVPDKLQLIGAFQLDHTYTVTTTWNNTDSTTTNTNKVKTSTGTDVSPAVGTLPVTDTTDSSSVTAVTQGPWTATPQFMVRLMPLPQLTVDLWGQSIMTAINQNFFGGAGFNPATLIGSLGLNVSFRF